MVALKGSVKEGEAFDIEHVNLIDEEHTGYDLGTALFAPLSNLLVDLLTDFGLDLTNITREKSHEALSARVNHINLMECHSVDDFLALLQLTFRALHEPGLGSNVVEVGAAGERATELGDLAAGLVNGDNIASDNLLLGDGFDHFGTEVIDRLHLGGL